MKQANMRVQPNPKNPELSTPVVGINESGTEVALNVVTERPMTLFLNAQEVVTMMTVGDHPDLLARGYLINQNILTRADKVDEIEVDDELGVVVVRTREATNFEVKSKKKVRTSGCAQGTIFGDVLEAFESIELSKSAKLHTSWLVPLAKTINTTPSLYLEAGAIHGCVLAKEEQPIVYFEDVGRHNAVDKVCGWMAANDVSANDKIFYTTGRLTSEMVLKTVMMNIPILISRSGFTAWGVELARKAGLTLIGRAKGSRFIVLSGHDRVIFDHDNGRAT